MTNSKALFDNIVARLCNYEDRKEAEAIVYQLLHTVLRITKTDVVGERKVPVIDWNRLNAIIKRINDHEPLQYILGQQEFYGRKFYVSPDVMIPRPETERLIDEAIAWAKEAHCDKAIGIADIGAGSGCLSVTLALELAKTKTYGLDNSKAALKIAAKNALYHGVDTFFYHCDILNASPPPLKVDVVVSNPPYITHSEKLTMLPNVLDYEPHKALFVPDNDPLLFYRSIARKSKLMFEKKGVVIIEINRRFGEQVVTLFCNAGYRDVMLMQDYCGNDRVVRATYQQGM